MSTDNRIKILHLIDSGGQGGAEQVLVSLIKKLGNEQYDHHVFLPGPGWLHDKLLNLPGIAIVFCNGGGRFNICYLHTIANYLKHYSIQLIHAHLLGTSLYASIVGFYCRVPVVCTFHGFIDYSHNCLQSIKLNLIGLCSSRIVTVSDSLKDYLRLKTYIGRDKYLTIHNGIDTNNGCTVTRSEARRYFGVPDDVIVIGSIGNVKPAKGYDILLQAAKIVSEKNSNCIFVVAGNTESAHYADLIKLRDELSLDDKIKFIGFLDNVDIFLRMLDLFVLSSISEGFSLATIEAMCAGIPVVATRSGGPQEIIVDGINGILVDSNNAGALADGMLKQIFDENGVRKLIDNAKRDVVNRFSIVTTAKKYEHEYSKLLRRGGLM